MVIYVNELPSNLENKIFSIGSEIIKSSKNNRRTSINDNIFDICMREPHTKTQLLRFIDVLPSLKNGSDIAEHFKEYLIDEEIDFGNLSFGFKAATLISQTSPKIFGSIVRKFARNMASNFICADNINKTAKIVTRNLKKGIGFSVDLLGERVTSEELADKYMKDYFHILDTLSYKFGDLHSFGKPNVNVSIKSSSLYSRFDPRDCEDSKVYVKNRLGNIFEKAKSVGAFVNLDVEHYQIKNLTGQIFKELLSDDRFCDFNAGIVVQAYLKDSEETLNDFIFWSKEHSRPITIRLVKGAYWDHEVMLAQKNNWELPVYVDKRDVDSNYEKLTNILLSNSDFVGTAIASHNVRSISNALVLKEAYKVPDSRFEVQMLYGMSEEVKKSLVNMKVPLRVYTPFGDLISGMSYLVRRILENSSNESFLRSFNVDIEPEELLRKPETNHERKYGN